MKTRIVTLMMLSCFFLTGITFAGEKETSKLNNYKSITSIIEKEIDYPVFASDTQLECEVYVDLTVKEDGSLVINASNSKAESMKEHCIKSLGKIKLKELKAFAGENVLLKINYQLIEQ